MGVVAAYSRSPGRVLVAHWVQHTLCYAWIYSIHTYFTERTKPGCLSLRSFTSYSIVLSGKPGDEAARAIAGAQAEVAGARAPVCPSLATALVILINVFATSLTLTATPRR